MAKRNLRVMKWLGTSPAVASCTACGQQFKVSLEDLKRTSDAQASLTRQFGVHVCQIPGKGGPGDQST